MRFLRARTNVAERDSARSPADEPADGQQPLLDEGQHTPMPVPSTASDGRAARSTAPGAPLAAADSRSAAAGAPRAADSRSTAPGASLAAAGSRSAALDAPSDSSKLLDETSFDLGVGTLSTQSVIGVEGTAETGGPEGPALELLDGAPSVEMLRELLHEVIDPELGLDIVELGLLRDVAIEGSSARVRFTVTTPACPLSDYIEDEIRNCLLQVPGLHDLDIACELEPAWKPEEMTDAAKAALGWEL